MQEYNITFIAALFALAFGCILGKRRAYWLTVTGIALCVLLVGASPGSRAASPASRPLGPTTPPATAA